MLSSFLLLASSSLVEVPKIDVKEPWDRRFAIDTHFGTDVAPYGAFGVSGEWTAAPWLGLAAGIGTAPGDGPRGGTFLHLRTGDRFRLGLASGIVIGRLTDDPNCQLVYGAYWLPIGGCAAMFKYGAQRLERAWMWDTQFALEGRTGSGVHVAFAVGVVKVLNRASDWRCLDECHEQSSATKGYMDLSIGWSFL